MIYQVQTISDERLVYNNQTYYSTYPANVTPPPVQRVEITEDRPLPDYIANTVAAMIARNVEAKA
jgi:hypothetical protein